jgi:hypothetical protein
MLRLGLLAFLPISLIGCLAAAPPHLVERDGWRVRAGDEATATLVAGMVADLAPRVRAELDGSAAAPCELWVQDELRYYSWPLPASTAGGFYVPSRQRIYVPADGMTRHLEFARYVLAHELVHQQRDEIWARLDSRLEEGLSDLVACKAVPDAAAELRAVRLLEATEPEGGMAIWLSFADDPRRLPALLELEEGAEDPYGEVDSHDYAPSFIVLLRLDEQGLLPALRAACVAAEGEDSVTLEEEAQLAGVDLEQRAVAALARAQMTRAALRFVLVRAADSLAGGLAPQRPAGAGDPDAEFTRMGLRFSLSEAHLVIEADDVPGMREAFVKAREALASAPAARR